MKIILPLFLCICLLAWLPAPAATIRVPADQPTIQAGVDAALDGDTIIVADGCYTGTGNINVVISRKAITLRSENGPQAAVIDCEELGRGLTIGPVEGGSVLIDGFTITNGRPSASDPFQGGGAVVFKQVTAVIQNCLLTVNQANSYGEEFSGNGGAIYIDANSNITVIACSFIENTGRGGTNFATGGAIYCDQSVLTIDDSYFYDNAVFDLDDTNAYASGGAVHADDSTVNITGTEIRWNYSQAYAYEPYSGGAVASGGGVSGTDSTVTIEESLIILNRVAAVSDVCEINRGAGICVYGTGSLALLDCRLTDNYLVDSYNTCFESLEAPGFYGSGHGGAVYSNAELTTITNCLFMRNEAEQVYVPYYRLEMDGCTVARGDPEYEGLITAGGVYCREGSIRNSIIWSNPEAQLYVTDQATVEYCAVEGGWTGTGNIDADPLFANGPLGFLYLSQVAAGQPLDSPCVDAGDPSSPIADGTTRTDSIQDADPVDIGYHYRPAEGLNICTFPANLTCLAELGGPSPEDRIIEIRPCMGGSLEWQVECSAPWLSLAPLSGVSTGEPDPVVVSIDSTGLSSGDYATMITVQAIGALNTPARIPVDLSVGQIVIGYSPSQFYFEEMIYLEPAEDQILQIWNDDLFTLNWTVSSDAPWLSLGPASGHSTGEQDQVTVHVDSTGMAAGIRDATITISDPGAVNSPRQIPVRFDLREMRIGHQPDSFAFHCNYLGPPPQEQRMEVWNAGHETMYFRVTDDVEWLTLRPTGGNSSGEHDLIRLIVEPENLFPGTFKATVTISAELTTNSPQFVPVTLVVDVSDKRPRLVTSPGPGSGNPSLIRVYPPEQDAALDVEFTAYAAPGYGTLTSCADLDHDYLDEILTGAGPGESFGPHVRGFEVDGTPLPGLSFLAYGTNKYGVNVAAGNLDGDGFDEIITGAGPGAVFGPHVRAFDYDGSPGVTPVPGVSFFAYGTPKWGVNVAAGDIDGDSFDEIVTGPGPGAVYGPHVRGWNVDGGPATAIPTVSFLAYGTNKFGVNVTAGDVDGDGIDEIVTGAGPGMVFGPHVRGWNFDGSAVTPLPGYSFFAWQTPPLSYGVNVFAGADLNNDGRDELVAGRGPDPGADTEVKVFTYNGTIVSQWISLHAYPGLSLGANVAAGKF